MIDNYKIKAPVVIFVYKRPEHTKKVISVIKNINIKKIYVVADGWKNENEKSLVNNTRNLFNNLEFDVKKIFFNSNMGLRKNAELGLKEVFKFENRVIVLEDDTLPEKSFFKFCDILLSKYENDKNISLITGSNFKTQLTENEKVDYFFSKYPCFWGWATWKDRWEKLFDNNMSNWKEFKRSGKFSKSFLNRRERSYWNERFDYHTKNLNKGTWDYPFLLNQFYYEKKSIIPKKNLISNIGYDLPTSINPNKTSNLQTFEIDFPLNHPSINYELESYGKFCSEKLFSKSKLLTRIRNKIKKIFNLIKI